MNLTGIKQYTVLTSLEYVDEKLKDKIDASTVYTKEEINNNFVSNEALENTIQVITDTELNEILI